MPAALTYTPIRDGYTFSPSYPVVEVQLEGGKLRKRMDHLYVPHIVTLNWVLTSATDYTRFMGFFRTTLSNGIDTFTTPLMTDIGEVVAHVCRPTGNLPRLTSQDGQNYYVSCTVEVQPNPTYTGYILYEEPNLVILNVVSPRLVGPIQPGDTIQIFHSAGTHPGGTSLDLDGTYTVDSVTDDDTLALVSPAASNSDWTVLAGLGAPGQYGDESNGSVVSTIMRLPT